MRKILTLIISLALVFTFQVTVLSDTASALTTESLLNSGTIEVGYNSLGDKKVKLLIEKDGKRYQYNVRNDGETEIFPLQMGNGEYKVSLFENIQGNQYSYISSQDVNLQLNNEKDVYLNSVQLIDWNADKEAISFAKKLTEGLMSEEEKVNAIYGYIVDNFVYDFEKLSNVQSGYIPDIDTTLVSKNGICFDFASMLAAMLRSSGIPTKLIMGYGTNVSGYHAWNEVYLESKGGWITVDTTYDMQMKAFGYDVDMVKDQSTYTKSGEY